MTKNTQKRYEDLLKSDTITKTQTDSFCRIMRELDRQYYLNRFKQGKAINKNMSEIIAKIKNKILIENYKLTKEQTEFGINWLRKYTFKKNGEPRQQKGNPFDEDHRKVINNFSHFLLVGFEDIESFGNIGRYRPIYRVVSVHGVYFDYTPNVPFNGTPIWNCSYCKQLPGYENILDKKEQA